MDRKFFEAICPGWRLKLNLGRTRGGCECDTPVLPFFVDKTSLRKEDVSMISTDSLHMMKDLLFNSHSLCHVPELAMALEQEQGGLIKLDLPLRVINCKVVGIRHKQIASGVIDHIFDFIEEYFESS